MLYTAISTREPHRCILWHTRPSFIRNRPRIEAKKNIGGPAEGTEARRTEGNRDKRNRQQKRQPSRAAQGEAKRSRQKAKQGKQTKGKAKHSRQRKQEPTNPPLEFQIPNTRSRRKSETVSPGIKQYVPQTRTKDQQLHGREPVAQPWTMIRGGGLPAAGERSRLFREQPPPAAT